MFGNEFVQNFGFVPIAPQDMNGGTSRCPWIDMTKWHHATAFIMVGETAGATFAVTCREAKDSSGTGAQTLAFTKYYSNGQKLLFTGRSTANFTVGETITGGTSNLTAYVWGISCDYLHVIPLTGGTTWTDGETITGGTSGATATVSGTGQDEDIFLDRTASSTFTAPAVTFKTYAIEVDYEELTTADGYTHFQVSCANPGTSTIGGGAIILTKPSYRGLPVPSAIGTQKIAATY